MKHLAIAGLTLLCLSQPGSAATAVVDDDYNIWTIESGQVYRNGVADTSSGTATGLSYSHGELIKSVNNSKNFCMSAGLKTHTVIAWPVGDNGWYQTGIGGGVFKMYCPQIR